MPRIVITHDVVDIERWLKGKDERAAAFAAAGTNVIDYVPQDGSNRVAVSADIHDLAAAEALQRRQPMSPHRRSHTACCHPSPPSSRSRHRRSARERVSRRRQCMAVKVIVELKATPGRRDELKTFFAMLIAELGPSLREKGSLGSTLYEVHDDPDTLVEIADWQSVEARDAVMHDPAAAEALAPGLELLAEPFKAIVLQQA
jgi:quinol monooxygenase YgiN